MRHGAIAITMLILSPLASMAMQDAKIPAPSQAEQRRAEADVKALFRDGFAAAQNDRETKRELARKLLAQAADTKNSPAARYVVLRMARDLATEALDLTTVFDSVDRLNQYFDLGAAMLTGATFSLDRNCWKAIALNNARKYASTSDDVMALTDAYLKLASEALGEKNFADALQAAQLAEQYAKLGKFPPAAEKASTMAKEIPELKKEDEQFGEVIVAKRDDAQAKLVKGRVSLFVVNDANAAMDMFLGCSDEGLVAVAKMEKAKPAAWGDMVKVAEAWLGLAKKEPSVLHKRRYHERAMYWFQEAIKNAGGLDKIRIEQRIGDLYKIIEPSPNGLVGRWTFDEGAGDTFSDSSGKGNHGAITGRASWDSGVLGRALAFDGSTVYGTASANGFPSISGTLTVAWAYKVLKNPSNSQVFISLRDEATGTALHPQFGGGKIAVCNWGAKVLVSANPPVEGEWHSIAYVFDGKVHRLYVDGTLRDSSTAPAAGTVPKYIDFGRWGGAAGGTFSGLLDEVRIYSRVLSDAEIIGLVRKRKS